MGGVLSNTTQTNSIPQNPPKNSPPTLVSFDDDPFQYYFNTISFHIPILTTNHYHLSILNKWIQRYYQSSWSSKQDQSMILITPKDELYHPTIPNDLIELHSQYSSDPTNLFGFKHPSKLIAQDKAEDKIPIPVVTQISVLYDDIPYVGVWYHTYQYPSLPTNFISTFNYHTQYCLMLHSLHITKPSDIAITGAIPSIFNTFISQQPSRIPFVIFLCDLTSQESISYTFQYLSSLSLALRTYAIPSLHLHTPLLFILDGGDKIDQIVCSERILVTICTEVLQFNDVRTFHLLPVPDIAQNSIIPIRAPEPTDELIQAYKQQFNSLQLLFDYLDETLLNEFYNVHVATLEHSDNDMNDSNGNDLINEQSQQQQEDEVQQHSQTQQQDEEQQQQQDEEQQPQQQDEQQPQQPQQPQQSKQNLSPQSQSEWYLPYTSTIATRRHITKNTIISQNINFGGPTYSRLKDNQISYPYFTYTPLIDLSTYSIQSAMNLQLLHNISKIPIKPIDIQLNSFILIQHHELTRKLLTIIGSNIGDLKDARFARKDLRTHFRMNILTWLLRNNYLYKNLSRRFPNNNKDNNDNNNVDNNHNDNNQQLQHKQQLSIQLINKVPTLYELATYLFPDFVIKENDIVYSDDNTSTLSKQSSSTISSTTSPPTTSPKINPKSVFQHKSKHIPHLLFQSHSIDQVTPITHDDGTLYEKSIQSHYQQSYDIEYNNINTSESISSSPTSSSPLSTTTTTTKPLLPSRLYSISIGKDIWNNKNNNNIPEPNNIDPDGIYIQQDNNITSDENDDNDINNIIANNNNTNDSSPKDNNNIQQYQFNITWKTNPLFISHPTTHELYRHTALAYFSDMAWSPTSIGCGIIVINLLSMFISSLSPTTTDLTSLIYSTDSTLPPFNPSDSATQSIIDRFQLDLSELYYHPYKIHIIFILPVSYINKYYLQPSSLQQLQCESQENNNNDENNNNNNDNSNNDNYYQKVEEYISNTYQQLTTPYNQSLSSLKYKNNTKYQSWKTSIEQFACIYEFIKFQSTIERIHLIQTTNYIYDENIPYQQLNVHE